MESEGDPVDAGEFADWLERFAAALRGDEGTDVPCGDCTGCCTSGYSLQLRPSDGPALALIPAERLLRVPGFAADERTLPARVDGSCQLLEAGRCSIYHARPQTCRDYDCRVFAAAGVDAGGPDKVVINRRVRAWRFRYRDESARQAHDAVRAAARFLIEAREAFVAIGARIPGGPMGIAVFALKAHRAFLDRAYADEKQKARAAIDAARAFDAGATGAPGR